MMNGMPINDEERSRIVDAINVVKLLSAVSTEKPLKADCIYLYQQGNNE